MMATKEQHASVASGKAGKEFERVTAEAARIPVGALKTCKGSTGAMLENVNRALSVLHEPQHFGRIKSELPSVDLEGIGLLHDAVHVVGYYAEHAKREKRPRMVKSEMAKAYEVRKTLAAALQLGSALNVIPAAKLATLPKARGSNPLTLGPRLIDTSILLREYLKQFPGGFLLDEAYLSEAMRLGSFLQLKGSEKLGRKPTKRDRLPLAEKRDRAYTLLVTLYSQARSVAGFLFGEQRDRFVPPLNSRKMARRAKPAPPAEAKVEGWQA